METIVVNGKTFVIKKCDNDCDKCLFSSNNNYSASYCIMTRCYDFIVVRKVNIIDKIRMWFKKKIKKYDNKWY